MNCWFSFDEFHVLFKEFKIVKKQIKKNQAQTDTFCPKYSDSEAPISVIANILSKNYNLSFANIFNEFDKLGFTKVKHLAQATTEKVSSMQLSGDSLTLLYGVIEIYSKLLDNLLKSAKLEFKNDNFYNTERICNVILMHKPADMDVIMLISNSFYKGGNYDKCIESLQTAKYINPNCSKVLYNLAVCYWEISEVDLAKKYLSEACLLQPSWVDEWTQYAVMLYKTNDFKAAELAYKQVLSLKPKLYKVRNQYGQVLLELDKIQDAKTQFEIALKSATECPETLKNLGYACYKIGQFEEAISCFKKAVEINPHLKNAHGYLGLAYHQVQDYQKSTTEFLKHSELDPENINILRNLGVAYCHQKNYELSAAVFKKCLKLEPDNFNLYSDLGLIYLINIKNYQEAIICFIKCIELEPEKKNAYINLYTAYKKNNDDLSASVVCMILGDMYLECDDQENARDIFSFSVLSNPENAFGYWKLGLATFNLGHLDLAFSRYKKAIEVNPGLFNYNCDNKKDYEMYIKYMKSRLDKELDKKFYYIK